MDNSTIIELIILVILILLSAFFSSAETALSSITDIKIKTLLDGGNKRAETLQRVVANYGKMLSAILIGNNIVNITASSLATTITIKTWGNIYVGYATGILTLVVLLFGEIVPKNMAKMRAENLALFYAPIIYGLIFILTPIIWLVDNIARGMLFLLGIRETEGSNITEAELRTYVDASHQEGVIESEEKVIINNVFDFSDAVAREIMIPTIDMVMVEDSALYTEIHAIFKDCMYTRLPVYKNERDNIIGLINIKDFILVNDKNSFKVSDIMRSGYYTYEYKKTADLMLELRQTANPVAFVLSEYGLCVGMITMEDLLEEIVGEIRDEFDDDELDSIRKVEKNVYMVEGSRKLEDVNDALGIKLESEDYDSIAGLILEHFDSIPAVGDEITLDSGVRLKVNEVNKNRITKVRLVLPPAEEE